MKVIFIYKNKSFNLNIKKDDSIDSIKNTISEMIKLDKSSFDLFYNNKLLSENDSDLSQMLKNENNILIVSPKDNKTKKFFSRNENMNLPVLTLSKESNPFKTEIDAIDDNEKLNLNESIIYSNSSTKIMFQDSKRNANSFIKNRKIKYLSRNKVFEDIYNQKEEIIINLMNDLKKEILEYDNILYNNYKNKYDNDNMKLLIFEKNILSFKDKQIQFLKKLMNYFDKTESTFFSAGKINLEGFYQELFNYYNNKNTNTFIQSYSTKKEKKIINNNNNIKIINISQEKLPKISINKNTEEILLQSNRFSKDSFDDNIDEIIKQKKEKNKSSKKQKIKNINLININNLSRISEDNNEMNLNFNDNKDTNEKITKNKKENVIISENVKTSNKNNFEKNIDNPNNIQLPKSRSKFLNDRELKIIYDKDKINSLFQTAENNQEKIEENVEDLEDEEASIDNVKDKKTKKKQIIEDNLKERKKAMKHFTNNSRIGYKFKIKDKKATFRLKKLGNNFSDFII